MDLSLFRSCHLKYIAENSPAEGIGIEALSFTKENTTPKYLNDIIEDGLHESIKTEVKNLLDSPYFLELAKYL